MYPLSRQLVDLVELFCKNPHKQPDAIVEYLSHTPPVTPKLVEIYNYVKMIRDPSYRHLEIQQYAEELLRKDYFVPKEGPLLPEERCFISQLPPELLGNIFRFCGVGGFSRLTQSNRQLLHVGYEWLARQSNLVSRYVSARLATEQTVKELFSKRVYTTPISLNLRDCPKYNLKILRRFPHVHSFHLQSTTINRQLLGLINRANHLRSLTLRQLRRELIDKVTFSQTLTNCDLSSTGLDDTKLTFILRTCTNLKRLSVASCVQLTGSSISQSPNVAFLEELNLSSCDSFQDAQFIAITAKASSLISLKVCYCYEISPEAFKQAVYPRTLRALLAQCCNIDDLGLQKILQLPRLEMLDLSNNFLLTRKVFQELTTLPPLKEVCFAGTYAEEPYRMLAPEMFLLDAGEKGKVGLKA